MEQNFHETINWLFSRNFAGQKGAVWYILFVKNIIFVKAIIQIWRSDRVLHTRESKKEFITTNLGLREGRGWRVVQGNSYTRDSGNRSVIGLERHDTSLQYMGENSVTPLMYSLYSNSLFPSWWVSPTDNWPGFIIFQLPTLPIIISFQYLILTLIFFISLLFHSTQYSFIKNCLNI